MRIEYDRANDAAYIYLVDSIPDGAATAQVSVQPPVGEAEITLDFDADGSLLGIEVLGAARVLPPAVLGIA